MPNDHPHPSHHAPAHAGDGEAAIAQAYAQWRRARYGAEPERRRFVTDTGIELQPVYTPADLAARGFDYLNDLGFPGEYPYTRGDRAGMYRTEPFVVSAYSGFGEATDCNRRFRQLLEIGAEQILVALDLPTQCGYDSDHEMSAGEVGQAGVAVSTLRDFELMFEGIAIEKVRRVGTLGNSIGPIVLAMFAVLGEQRGLRYSDYTVNLQNDPLKEYLARGTQILPPRPAVRLATDAVTWCARHAPNWSPMTVCVNHLNAAGAGSSMATAIALANAIAYLDTMLANGFTIDEIGPLLHMFADERHDFFVQVANLRALRRIWARMMKERYGATNPAAMALRTTVYGHGQETLQEPLNNIVRIGFGTLGYMLGGASYVYIASYDEAVSTPTDSSVRIALRTQQILAHEHGFCDTIDPLGGSYFVESLTSDIERQIVDGLAMLESHGGAFRVIESGLGRRIASEGAVRRQKAIDSGARPWITVNKWPQVPNVPYTAFRIDTQTTQRQIARLDEVKRQRDPQRVAAALSALDRACASSENVMPATIEAVRAMATVGEMCAVFRARFGEFEPSTEF